MTTVMLAVTHVAASTPPAMLPEHPIPNIIKAPLQLVFALGWSSIYIMAIRRGFIEKWLGIPLIALAGDIAWEFMFSVVFHVDSANRVINVTWFAIDLVIVAQAMRFGRRDYPLVSGRAYRWNVAGLFAFAFGFMYTLPHDLSGDFLYPALLLDCFLSYMFLLMLRRRGSTAGQTMYIAVIKLVANAAATVVAIGNYPHRYLFYLLFVTTTVLDVLYLVELRQAFTKEGAPAWNKI